MDTKLPSSFEDSKHNEEPFLVKVHMEGYAVGRKINLKAYDNYDSLSIALRNMFTGLMSKNCEGNSEESNGKDDAGSSRLLVYEDYDGEKMLVENVPWEKFVSTVKRLYILIDDGDTSLVQEKIAKIWL